MKSKLFRKKSNTNNDKKNQKKSNLIFFKNSPIDDEKDDVFDFGIKAAAIEKAIENGSNMIALIGDYGTGKSSLTKILYKRNIQNFAEPIFINLWDCLSTTDNNDEKNNVSYFTKSFLYQLALGNQNHNNFSRYINQRLSKNYGKLSFALAKKKTLCWIFLLGISLVLFFILKDSLLPDTIGKFILKDIQKLKELFWYRFIMFLSSVRYIFLFLAGISLYNALKNNNILFSLWDSQGKIEPTDTDCFEVFEEIISKITNECDDKKQLIIIEDLDRSDNSKAVLALLKEIYRFNNLLSTEERNKIVFIVSLKSEASLLEASNEIGKNYQKAQQIYSKIFDYTVWIRPIHFANAREIIAVLLKEQIDENTVNQELSKLYWIMKGDNLTVREIKDRLNETYLLYQSLTSRKDNSSVDLKKCACVVYLQRQYPDEFLNLTSKETELAELIEKFSYKYGGDITLITNDDFDFIYKRIINENNQETIIKSEKFEEEFKKILEEKIIENDYRMYFYNYPASSYIMTGHEKNVYDFITFDKTTLNQEDLNNAIKITINDYNGTVIKNALNEIEHVNNKYGVAIFLNELLFEYVFLYKKDYVIESFQEYFQKSCNQTGYKVLCFILKNKVFDESKYSNYKIKIINLAIYTILGEYKKLGKEFLTNARFNIIPNITKENIYLFAGLFTPSPNIPLIEPELLHFITSPLNLAACTNYKLINQNNYKPYFDCILNISFNKDDSIHLFNGLKSISNLKNIPDIEDFCIKIFKNNKVWDTELFSLIYDYYSDNPEILIDLVSETDLTLLNDDDFIKINNLQTSVIKDLNLLIELEKRNLFNSSLYSRITNNNLINFNFKSEKFLENLPAVAQNIFSLQPECFIKLRKVLIQNAELAKESIFGLFNSNYPFVTEEDLNLVKNVSDFYWVISFSDVTIDNCLLLSKQCNKRKLSGDELFDFFNAIFLYDEKINIGNPDIIWKILETINFDNKLFNSISTDKQDKIISYLNNVLSLSDINNCLRLLKTLHTHINKIDLLIQEECNDSDEILTSYIDLCKNINSIPDYVMDFIINKRVETNYPKFITDNFLEKKAYYLYIIGKSLEDQIAFYNEGIQINNYKECFINNDSYFELVKDKNNLLEKIFKSLNSYENIKLNRLLSFVEFPQNFALIKSILDLTDNEQKKNYLMRINEIASYKDSNKFLGEITKTTYAELFKYDKELYYHVLNLLWTHDEMNIKINSHYSFKQIMSRRNKISFR